MKVLDKYQELVRNNAEVFSASEWALSNLTWLLPDRFSNSELRVEGLHAVLGLISLYHESITSVPPAPAPKGKQPLPWVFWLGAIQQVEVLVELGANNAQQTRQINKYGPLASLEALKAALRLLILYKSNSRILTDGGLTTEGTDTASPGSTPEAKARAVYSAFARFREKHCLPLIPRYPRPSLDNQHPAVNTSEEPATPFGLAHPSSSGRMPSFGRLGDAHVDAPESPKTPQQSLWWDAPSLSHDSTQAGDGTLPFASTEEDSDPASPSSRARTEHLRKLEAATARRQAFGLRLIVMGELLHVMRPVIYTLALRKYGRQSWRPWLISLGVEAASAAMTDAGAAVQRQACTAAADDPTLHHGSLALLYSMQSLRWSSNEVRELIRRRLLFLYYIIRSPFFDLYTRPPVERVQGWLHRIPLVSSISNKATEILFGIQDLYTYTSAS